MSLQDDTGAADGSHTEDPFEYCANCGAALPNNEWCPVDAATDGEGTVVLRAFCDERCTPPQTDDES